MIYLIFILLKHFCDPWKAMHGGTGIMEKTISFRVEMFHNEEQLCIDRK